MTDNKQPHYTLWHAGDLIATGKHNRATLDEFIAQGCELVEAVPHAGEAEIFSSHDDDRVWHLTYTDLHREYDSDDLLFVD